MLALLDPQLDAFGHAGHDLDVVAAEAQLLGYQAGDGAAQDGLGAQGRVLLPQCQGPAHTEAGRATLTGCARQGDTERPHSLGVSCTVMEKTAVETSAFSPL